MSDFRDIEVRSSNQSLIISIVIGILSLLLLLVTFTFEDTYPKFQPIEIAMNFGNTDVGQGEAEPMPAETQQAAESSSSAVEQPQTVTPSTPVSNAVTQNTTETRPVATKTPAPTPQPKSQTKPTPAAQPTESPQPTGDAKANSALSSLIGGKGKANSGGQGKDGTAGNVGDPKGSDSDGTGIGQNWKSTIPEPQSHDCTSSGVIVVDIIVNASGGIKSAIPGARGSTSNDACLKTKAKSLVEQYVRAYPGSDGRRGTYKVNLR